MFAVHLGSVARKKRYERVFARSDASSSEPKLLGGMLLFRLLMPAELDQDRGWDNKSIQPRHRKFRHLIQCLNQAKVKTRTEPTRVHELHVTVS
jgi:hypothetical protein